MTPGAHLLTVLVFFPALGALALMILRADDHAWIRRMAVVVGTFEFLLSLLLIPGVPLGSSGYRLELNIPWITSPPIHYHMGVDGLSMFLVILTTFLTPISILASWNSVHQRVKEFFVALLMLEVGVVGVFLSLDLFLFFLFWEIMLIPMALLIGIWGHERRIYAAVKFVLYTMAGSILMLVGILWLYNNTGTFDLIEIQRALQSGVLVLSERSEILLFLAFFGAFAIKVPLFPLHTWLPDAHVEAPTAGSVILAGVLLIMGTYGFIRFSLPLLPKASSNPRSVQIMVVLSIIAIVYGALVSLMQRDMKKLIAYSSVSHLGFCTLGIFALNPHGLSGSVIQQINHGISTGGLFLIVGLIYERRHTREIKELGGLSNVMPIYATLFMIIMLSSVGLPLLNGFIGEFTILQGAFEVNWHWAAWAVSGIVLGAAYLLWLYQRTMFGTVDNPKNQVLKDLNWREIMTLVPLIVWAFWIGLYPKPFFNVLEKPVTAIVQRVNPNFFTPPPANAAVPSGSAASAAPAANDSGRGAVASAAQSPIPAPGGAH